MSDNRLDILFVMDVLGLSRDDAREYIMEREYNQKSHSQAMAELNRKVGK